MKKILCIGDLIDDVFHWCRVPKLCPEAPVPVAIVEKTESRPGGAANVARNLQTLSGGSQIVLKIMTSASKKTRYFCGNHLLLRVDEDGIGQTGKLMSEVNLPLEDFGAIIISDYNKGGMTDKLADSLIYDKSENRRKVPVFVDTKYPYPEDRYANAFCIFPNEHEHTRLEQVWSGEDVHIVRKLGAKGCTVDGTPVATKEQPVFDVTGAGDTFLAAFVLAFLDGRDLIECAKCANKAAGISVRHVGTYAVTKEDMEKEPE